MCVIFLLQKWLNDDITFTVKLRNNKAWLPATFHSCVSDVLTFLSGRGYKALFFSPKSSTNSILWEQLKEGRATSPWKGKTHKRDKKSKLADEPLANQVIIRKESKSYRMSGIQNLHTFGKSFFKSNWTLRRGGGRASVHEANVKLPKLISTFYLLYICYNTCFLV